MKRDCDKKECLQLGEAERNEACRIVCDTATSERWQHAGRILLSVGGERIVVAQVVEEDILDILFLRGVISARQKEAGLRFKADFLAADLAAHLVSSYSPVRYGGASYASVPDRSDKQEAAYRSWRKAVVHMGAMFSGCVVSTVCYDEMPDEARHLPLQMGLIKLAGYYGVASLNQDVDKAAAGQVAVGHQAGSGAVSRRVLH